MTGRVRHPAAPAPSAGEASVTPEALKLRTRPAPVTRINRKVLIGGDGKPALVNYRVKGTTYIVDRLFAAAELRHGTAPQQVVRIIRTDAVWKERSP